MTMESETRAKAREVGAAVAQRAEHDQAFQQQLNEDPIGTLIGAGMPPEALGDVLRDAGLNEDNDVNGFLLAAGGGLNAGGGVSQGVGCLGSTTRINCGGTALIPVTRCTLSKICEPVASG